MADDSTDRPFLGRTLATVAAVFSILSTAAGLWSAQKAEEAKAQAEATQRAFDQLKLNKEYQLHVFELVDKSLSSPDGGLVLASAYASSLDDAKLQKSLADAIRTVAAARSGGRALSSEETAALSDLASSVQSAALAQAQTATKGPAGVANPTSDVNVKATVNAGRVNPLGWDVDVFSCAAKGAPSQALAQRVAQDLAAKANAGSSIGGQKIGRVRLRVLSTEAQGRGGYPTDTNEVRSDVGEEAFADAVASSLNARPGGGFTRRISMSKTPWYVSVFACGI